MVSLMILVSDGIDRRINLARCFISRRIMNFWCSATAWLWIQDAPQGFLELRATTLARQNDAPDGVVLVGFVALGVASYKVQTVKGLTGAACSARAIRGCAVV